MNSDDKMLIAMASGNMMNIRVKAEEMSFREFGEFCSVAQKGIKHEAYFLRGVPNIEKEYKSGSGKLYYDGRFRHDSSIPTSDFMIIDADNSKCSPSKAHEILVHMSLSHFIYTTHSHFSDSNNFRCVIPCFCKLEDKKQLVLGAKDLMKGFTGDNEIKYVKEMGTWSQAWFLPTRDDPKDGLFEFYSYYEGNIYEIDNIGDKNSSDNPVHNSNSNDNIRDTDAKLSIEKIIATMKEYSAGTHHAIRDYSYGMIKDGVPYKTVIETIKGFMEDKKDDSDRNLDRYNSIERIVKGAIDTDDNITPNILFPAPNFPLNGDDDRIMPWDAESIESLNWPPGLMGELSKCVYEFSPYPNQVISIVTGLGLIAGIAGRRFNISGNGLNLYITLLMDTGGGKSVISKFITRVLNDAGMLTGATSFTGSGRYTGPKALMDDLLMKRCIISVFTEAGFMFRSKSGDQDGLTRCILDLYGSSGYGCSSAGGSYSNDKNNIVSVVSPCFSMINESTPDIFLETLKDGDKTGELNRMTVLRVEQETTNFNREMRYYVGDDVRSRLKALMARCYATQNKDDADVTNFRVTDELYDFADKMKLEGMECKDSDYTRFSMLQRSAEKAFKVSALVTLFNQVGAKGDRMLELDEEAINWAMDLHKYEMAGLEDFFDKVSAGDDMFEFCCAVVYKTVKKLLSGRYKDKKMQPDIVLRNKNMIPLSMFRYSFKRNNRVKDFGNSNISGIDRLIKWLKDESYIKIRIDKYNGKRYIVVSESFMELGEYVKGKSA